MGSPFSQPEGSLGTDNFKESDNQRKKVLTTMMKGTTPETSSELTDDDTSTDVSYFRVFIGVGDGFSVFTTP